MIRTRFAPSPTGHLHIGGLRTALYAYLFARKNQGHFLLRIEDTDRNRFVEGATEHLIEVMQLFGLEFDEGPGRESDCGPFIQSERTEMYREAAQNLLENGHAYRCFCTAERLDVMREQQVAAKKAPMYDRHCCNLSDAEIEEKMAAGLPYVVRLKIPYEKPIQFDDLVRGKVTFDPHLIDDQILLKSDGFPTYHLANVVDDHYMKITHVIRGEEWLPSTPKHVVLYQAFGWEAPEFAHLPLILNKDRTKLSKRQNDVNVESYLEKKYLKEAILNFIAFLGWHPGDGEQEEIMSLEDLVEKFSLKKVHKGGAVFDLEKFDWFNWQWRRKKFMDVVKQHAKTLEPNVKIQEVKKGHLLYVFQNPDHLIDLRDFQANQLIEMTKDFLEPKFLENMDLLKPAIMSVEDKVLKDPKQINDYVDFYFEITDYNSEMFLHQKMKVDFEMAKKSLVGASEVLEELTAEECQVPQKLKEVFVTMIKSMGVKNGQVLWPLRVALSGKEFSPGAFDLIFVLGKKESLLRLEKAIAKLL